MNVCNRLCFIICDIKSKICTKCRKFRMKVPDKDSRAIFKTDSKIIFCIISIQAVSVSKCFQVLQYLNTSTHTKKKLI